MLKQNTPPPASAASRIVAIKQHVWTPTQAPLDGNFRLRVLSYNIQVGLQTGHYGHYVTRAWRHALPGPGMHSNLDLIAEIMRGYDFVAIQEADAGSLRTQFTNQVEYLARRAGFAHWGLSITRDLRPVARHALAFLSRYAPAFVEEHVLPSRIPGRRALRIGLGADAGGLQLLVAHLSLGSRARNQQLDYLNQLVPVKGPVVLLGDLNCDAQTLRRHAGTSGNRLCVPRQAPLTFPSWHPRLGLDHILHSADIQLHRLRALPHAISDHLPLAAEIELLRPQ